MRRWEREESTTLGHANLCYRFIFHFKIHLSQLLTLIQCMMCKQVFCNATACTIYHPKGKQTFTHQGMRKSK